MFSRFIERLCSKITLKATPVSPSDFPHLDWRLAESGAGGSSVVQEDRGTQLGFYDLQIPCATTNARHDRKLSLVLDLDQTLVHAVKLSDIFSDPTMPTPKDLLTTDNPNHVQSVTERIEFKGAGGSEAEPRQLLATRLDGEMYLIKLRPGLREFLKDLAIKYELHIYTKANRNYLNFLLYELDPVGKLFTSAVARDDSPDLDTDLKILNRVCCRNMAEVVVFDDRVDVWNETPGNVVQAQPYNFLSQRRPAIIKAMNELEEPQQSTTSVFDYDSHLYAIKNVLLKIFDEYIKAEEKVAAPHIIAKAKKEVLKGQRLQFSGFTDVQSHIKEAEEFGAICSTVEDSVDDGPSVLVAAKHTKKVYDVAKNPGKVRIVHWSWMDHVRSTWELPNVSVFDLQRFRVDASGVYPPIDDWEVAYIAATAEPKGSDRSSKRRRDKE